MTHDPSLWGVVHDKWSYRFLQMAALVAGWSKDPSTKVGCVIADHDKRVISTGYNGFPTKTADDARLDDREMKYKLTIHAEANALLQAGARAMGCTAFVTHPPCATCMGMLINCGIRKVICPQPSQDYLSRWGDSMGLSEAMAQEAGVLLSFARLNR